MKWPSRGEPARRLAISAISSFVAGTLGLVGLTFFAPLLADVAVAFGPPEYFALMFMALSLIISLSGRALLKGIISMALGLMTALIGQDPLTGAARLTFGFPKLLSRDRFHQRDRGALRDQRGDDQRGAESHRHQPDEIGNWMPTWADVKQCIGGQCSAPRVSVSSWGSFPGCTPSVTTFVAYDLEKRVSKHPERFGHGAIEGVAAPEGANNATSSAGFVPLFSFGIPTAPSMAVLLGGLMMYGLQPGPMLFKQNPQFVWAIIASMYIGNVMLIVLNLPLVGMWARICVIPFYILGPLIVFFSVLGTYSIRFLAFDVWIMFLFGVIGYFMRKLGYPVAPMVLATVIAQMMETSLGQSLLISQGSPLILFTRPISAVFMGLAILSIGRGIWIEARAKALEVAIEDPD